MNRFLRMFVLAGFFGAVTLGSLSALAADTPDGLYLGKCKTCHAEDGSGKKDGEWLKVAKTLKLEKPEGLNILSDTSKKMTDDEMVKVILEGKDKMKAMKEKVTADEAKTIVAYVRTLQAKAK